MSRLDQTEIAVFKFCSCIIILGSVLGILEIVAAENMNKIHIRCEYDRVYDQNIAKN